MTGCFLAQFSNKPCEGRLVRVHLIPKQLLKRTWRSLERQDYPLPFDSLTALLADERAWVDGCGGIVGIGGHHGMLDHSRTLRIPRSAIPDGTVELAEELGLGWWLDREYGEIGAAA